MCLSFRTRVDVESRVRVNGQQSNQIPRDGRTILLATFATKGGRYGGRRGAGGNVVAHNSRSCHNSIASVPICRNQAWLCEP